MQSYNEIKIIPAIRFTQDRMVMVINGYSFYTSSGKNSKTKGVLYPFNIILEKKRGTFDIGTIIKPGANAHLGFPDSKIQELLTNNRQLGRFGNIEAMLISLAFSEHAWSNHSTLKELSEYLKSIPLYSDYIKKLRETNIQFKCIKDYSSHFKIKNPDRTDTEIYAKKINRWLSSQKKIYHVRTFPIYDTSMQNRLENPTLRVEALTQTHTQNRLFKESKEDKKQDKEKLATPTLDAHKEENTPELIKYILEAFKQIAIACISNLIPFSFFDQLNPSKNNNNYSPRNKR